jgi:hypothetical protein
VRTTIEPGDGAADPGQQEVTATHSLTGQAVTGFDSKKRIARQSEVCERSLMDDGDYLLGTGDDEIGRSGRVAAIDRPPFDRFVDQVIHSWRQEGGEPDVGRWIPGWLESSGFEVLSVRAIVEVVTPRDYMWQWPREFVRVGSQRLRRLGAIDASEAEETWRAFAKTEALPGARMITPSVMEIIARAV